MPGSAAKKIETGYKHQNRNNNYTEQFTRVCFYCLIQAFVKLSSYILGFINFQA